MRLAVSVLGVEVFAIQTGTIPPDGPGDSTSYPVPVGFQYDPEEIE